MYTTHPLQRQASILRIYQSRSSKLAYARTPCKRLRVQRCVALEEADWEEEMSLFRKRLQKPNQLETMRKIVEEVDIGKVHCSALQATVATMKASAFPRYLCIVQVLLVGDGFAVIQGLNNDAPVGCSLKFVSGASGVLLWRRSDNICLALLLGGTETIEVGEGVECRIRAILQARPVSLINIHSTQP